MGHKTRLHFPQAGKKPTPPPSSHLPCQSTRPLREACLTEECVCVCVCYLLHTPLENTQPAGFGVTSHWDIFR